MTEDTSPTLPARSGVSMPGLMARSPTLWSTLAVSCWTGLVAGFAEMASFQVRVGVIQGGILRRSPHVYWMMPLSNMILFALIGITVEILGSWIPRWAGLFLAVSLSSMGFLAVLLTLPGLRAVSALLLAIGLGSWIGPALVARSNQFAKVVRWTLPAMIAGTLAMAVLVVSVRAGHRTRLDPRTPVPPPGAPNVLFIVLDTVRFDSTSLDGYGRKTTPFLESLAARGASFSRAIAPASWTLPSHASMFTSRWPWELGVGPDRPLGPRFPTLAEWMSDRGYRTGGIVANTVFCSEEYGLSRGFQHYEDYVVDAQELVRASSIGWLVSSRLLTLQARLAEALGFDARPPQTEETHRKTASEINEAALNWIGKTHDRPYFLFLNYIDAHDPYILPKGQPWLFGNAPTSLKDWAILRDWDAQIQRARNPHDVRLAHDAYENCLAYLDRQLASLFERLDAAHDLDNTIVVITADHGELFGENSHAGRPLYGHGEWVYQPVVHVPLLIVAPRRIPSGIQVNAAVSLRDLPATLVELTDHRSAGPFLGGSLVPLAQGETGQGTSAHSIAFSEFDPYRDLSHESQATRPSDREAMQSVVAEDYVYHHSSAGNDALYDVRAAPGEPSEVTIDGRTRSLVERMRRRLHTVAPILPGDCEDGLANAVGDPETGPLNDRGTGPEGREEGQPASRLVIQGG